MLLFREYIFENKKNNKKVTLTPDMEGVGLPIIGAALSELKE